MNRQTMGKQKTKKFPEIELNADGNLVNDKSSITNQGQQCLTF